MTKIKRMNKQILFCLNTMQKRKNGQATPLKKLFDKKSVGDILLQWLNSILMINFAR